MARKKRAKCGELPEEAISYILSRLQNARYVARASMVCKSWNRASMYVNNLNFYHGQPIDWYRMIRARLDALEGLHFSFASGEGMELCLGVAGACRKLSRMILEFKITSSREQTAAVVRSFNVLRTFSSSLAALTLLSTGKPEVCLDAFLGRGWKALKVLKICGTSMRVDPKELRTSAFPALEDLEWIIYPDFSSLVEIESASLQRLTVSCGNHSTLHVKAPKLTSLIVVPGGTRVHCESAAMVSCIQVSMVDELICSNASHVSLLDLFYVKTIRFPKLVSLQELKCIGKPDESPVPLYKLPAAALACVGTATLILSGKHTFGPELGSLFNNMQQLKTLTLTSSVVMPAQPPPVCLRELKSIRYIFRRPYELSLLPFIVQSAPALVVLDISGNLLELENGQLFRTLFQLQRSNPKLVINPNFEV